MSSPGFIESGLGLLSVYNWGLRALMTDLRAVAAESSCCDRCVHVREIRMINDLVFWAWLQHITACRGLLGLW